MYSPTCGASVEWDNSHAISLAICFMGPGCTSRYSWVETHVLVEGVDAVVGMGNGVKVVSG